MLMHIEGGELDKSKRRGEDKLEHRVSKGCLVQEAKL